MRLALARLDQAHVGSIKIESEFQNAISTASCMHRRRLSPNNFIGFDPENRYNFRRRCRQKLMVQMDRAVSIVSEKFPYQDEDVAKVLEALCVDPKFLAVLSGWWMPRFSKWVGPLATYLVSMRLKRAVRGCIGCGISKLCARIC